MLPITSPLIKRALKPLTMTLSALAVSLTSSAFSQDVMGNADLTGSGSTFAMPIIQKWAKAYRDELTGSATAVGGGGLDDAPNEGLFLDYEPSGSQAGILRAQRGAVNFGVSDKALSPEDLNQLGLEQFPIVIGGIVIATNIEGVPANTLHLTGTVLADIYLGKITQWSDPALASLNPGLTLPNQPIKVIRRADGSGTTYHFAAFLSDSSATWKKELGAAFELKWPVGQGVKGNKDMATTIAATPNSIGYVQDAYAKEYKLQPALIQNAAGQYPVPESKSYAAAAASVKWEETQHFAATMTQAPGAEAYPLTAAVYVMLRKDAPARQARRTLSFFRWCLTRGAPDATALGYVPLPAIVVDRAKQLWTDHWGWQE